MDGGILSPTNVYFEQMNINLKVNIVIMNTINRCVSWE